MARQDDSNGLAADLFRDTPSLCLLRDQPDRPSSPAIGCRTTDHRYYGSLLRAIEPLLGLPSRVIRERRVEPARQVSLADSRDFSWVAADRLGRCPYRTAFVEQLQDPDTAPGSRRHLGALGLQPSQAGSVFVGQLETRETSWLRHPVVRSEPDPGGKNLVIRKPRSED